MHADQSIEVLKPLPVNSGDGWTIRSRIVAVQDTGKGLIVRAENVLVSPSGEAYTRMVGSSYNFGKFDAGGFSKSIASQPPVQGGKQPTHEPDHVWVDRTTEEQAALYRLSGDYNPLHVSVPSAP